MNDITNLADLSFDLGRGRVLGPLGSVSVGLEVTAPDGTVRRVVRVATCKTKRGRMLSLGYLSPLPPTAEVPTPRRNRRARREDQAAVEPAPIRKRSSDGHAVSPSVLVIEPEHGRVSGPTGSYHVDDEIPMPDGTTRLVVRIDVVQTRGGPKVYGVLSPPEHVETRIEQVPTVQRRPTPQPHRRGLKPPHALRVRGMHSHRRRGEPE